MYQNIHKFNDDEVARIIRDVKEKIYSNVRDKLILTFLLIQVFELVNYVISKMKMLHTNRLKYATYRMIAGITSFKHSYAMVLMVHAKLNPRVLLL
ncbi:hypothetical protein AT278_04780 [Bacillus cereus]|nr:hypothetical protein AT278_04780 [Bacillus cereus]